MYSREYFFRMLYGKKDPPLYPSLSPSHQVLVVTFLTIPNLPSTLNISPDPWERIRPYCFHSVGLSSFHPLLRISVLPLSPRCLLWWLLSRQWPTRPTWNCPLCIITYSKAPAVSTTTGIQTTPTHPHSREGWPENPNAYGLLAPSIKIIIKKNGCQARGKCVDCRLCSGVFCSVCCLISPIHLYWFSLFFFFCLLGTVSTVLPLLNIPGLAVLMERMFQQPTGQDL